MRNALSPSRLLRSAALAAAGVVFGSFVVIAGLSSSAGFAWKTFLSMAALTICFASGSAISWLDSGRPVPAARLTGALGALATASLGLLILTSWDGSGWVYVGSLVMVAVGVGAYWALRENLLTLPVVFGALIFVSRAYFDIVGDDGDGTGTLLVFGIVLVVLGAAIVAAGWPFGCRHLTGALGSIVAVGAMLFVLALIGVVSSIARAFAGGGVDPGFAHSNRDLWIALLIGIAVSLAVAGLGAVSDLDRYFAIAFTGGALCTLIGVVTVARVHPLRTAAAFAVAAGLVVAAAVLADRINPKPTSTAPPAEWPPVGTPPPSAAAPPPTAPGSTPAPAPPPPSATTDTATMPPVEPPPPTRDPGSSRGTPPPS
jgi:hypothetical protein